MSYIKKTAFLITIISLISKLFGFIREVVFAYFFGTSYVVDAYLMACSIPTILFGFLLTVSISYVPIYIDINQNSGEEKSKNFTSNILSIVFILALLFILIGIIFNKQILSIVSSGFEGEVFDLTSYYLKISIWITLFAAPTQLLSAYLNCNSGYIQSSVATLAISSIQLIVIFIAGKLGSSILIYGVVLSNFVQFIIVCLFSYKLGYKYKFKIEITSDVKKSFIIIIPIFISSMISQINTFVDKSFASELVEGSIAALNYGSILKSFLFITFTIAITTMIYPMLSQAVAENNVNKVKDIFSKGSNIIIILFVPITIGAIILAKPAISFVFERGEFGSSSVMMTTSAFIMYSIGLLAGALSDVITKVFYSMKDTKSTLFIGAFAVGLNIVFNIILVKPMGHAGLALATSLSAIISIPLFFIVLRKKLGALGLKNTMMLFIKACVSTAVMGLIVYFGFNYLSSVLGTGKLSVLLSIIISSGIGGIVYFALMIALKVKEMDFFTDIIKKVLSKLF